MVSAKCKSKRKFVYGMPVWYGDGSITAGVKRAAALGFDYVEISLDHPWPESIRDSEVRSVLKIASSPKGIRFAFHAPLAGLGLAHPRPQLRNASVSVMKSCIDFACKFKPRLLYFNIHISTETSVTLELGTVVEDILEAVIKSRDELTAYGRRKGVMVVFENTQEAVFGMPSQVNLATGKGASFCFDIGHAAIMNAELEGAGLPAPDISDWIDVFKNRIKVCHLHDFNAKVGMDHLPPGEGGIDLRKALRLLRDKTKARYVLLEVFRHKTMKPASSSDLMKCLELVKKWA